MQFKHFALAITLAPALLITITPVSASVTLCEILIMMLSTRATLFALKTTLNQRLRLNLYMMATV